ncbi:MAG TPA: pyrroline-5-carboxylate reductase [Polaromonas sp.]|uniref:pyrroline-5-carboxylate reductase n=1 Tax=Polaromonas sp. TaxID=1869339 RepID=UPI002D37DFE4|nr:pyrroline-5-carboxylate reductase [Polaromonas sp.]HYW57078.1 pyrroline-5-carboxylate reductase [Polaromonas sp.]
MSTPSTTSSSSSRQQIAFIGGGNMASALIGGLLKRGLPASQIQVVEPWTEQQTKLQEQFDVQVHDKAGESLGSATLVVWAVKPQTFKDAALATRFHTKTALHLSVAAGIRSDSIAHWLGTQRVVRSMPNTPALIGKGVTALFPRPAVSATDRKTVERVIRTTGDFIWLDDETHLDAVTALSGSGPAYVFYFIEAMVQAGVDMGLGHEQAHKLAVGTFAGAAELARLSTEPPEILRARVTSKGGTTYAALSSMEQDDIKKQFMRAIHAARRRAAEMGDEFGA